MTFLTLNAGSSSVKFRLFGNTPALPVVAEGKVSNLGTAPVFKATRNGIKTQENLPPTTTQEDAFDTILTYLDAENTTITAAVHRIVHGGTQYTATTRLTPQILQNLHALSPLAPLHQPHNLAGVHILTAKRPHLPQFGSFDTAFHSTHTELATTFALPEELRTQGLRRYGYHGLSYAWVARWLQRNHPTLFQGRVVAAHLGNGASLCAMQGGQSVDTTMGLSTLDGLPMGTRCGTLDAGAVLYMQQILGLSADETAHILYEESGLKGLSGISNDMQTLLANPSPQAKLAVNYFTLKTAQHIATMATSLGGIDALVFTGGIGENAPHIRSAIQHHLSFLPKFQTLTLPADEERAMAEDLQTLLT